MLILSQSHEHNQDLFETMINYSFKYFEFYRSLQSFCFSRHIYSVTEIRTEQKNRRFDISFLMQYQIPSPKLYSKDIVERMRNRKEIGITTGYLKRVDHP